MKLLIEIGCGLVVGGWFLVACYCIGFAWHCFWSQFR